MKYFYTILISIFLLFVTKASAQATIATISPVNEPEIRENTNWINFGDVPVQVGILLNRGSLKTKDLQRLELVDMNNQKIQANYEITGVWHDNKEQVKWLLIRFKSNPNTLVNTDNVAYALRLGVTSFERIRRPKLAKITGRTINVNIGSIKAKLVSNSKYLISRFYGDNRSNLPRKIRVTKPNISSPFSAGKRANRVHNSKINHHIEFNSSNYVRIRSTQRIKYRGKDFLDLIVRQHYYKGAKEVKIELTYTWLEPSIVLRLSDLDLEVKLSNTCGPFNLKNRVREISVGRTHINGTIEEPYRGSNEIFTNQLNTENAIFGSQITGTPSRKRIIGWLRAQNDLGMDLQISAKNFWQEYPKAFDIRNNRLKFKLMGESFLSFGTEEFLTENYFSFLQSGIFDNPNQFHQNQCIFNPVGWSINDRVFKHNGQGISKTQEIALYPKIENSDPQILHSLVQQPVLFRQNPTEFCLRSHEVFGFRLPNYEPERFPIVESKIEDIANLLYMRWNSTLDYGNLRFGAIKSQRPGSWHHRTYDGTQYGLQIIPWILYLRGGDRKNYEEALNTSYHGMDISTNHYSTWPEGSDFNERLMSGYQVATGSSYIGTTPNFLQKTTKLDFLSLFHHITGNQRAENTMEKIVAGIYDQYQAALNGKLKVKNCNGNGRPVLQIGRDCNNQSEDQCPSLGGREKNNMLSVFAQAILEGKDMIRRRNGLLVNPIRFKGMNEQLVDLSIRNPESGPYYWLGYDFNNLAINRENQLYLTDGLLQQNLLGNRELTVRTRRRINSILNFSGFNESNISSVINPYLSPLTAFEENDPNQARIAWDIALGIADIFPQTQSKIEGENELEKIEIPEDDITANLIDQGYSSMPKYLALRKDYLMPILAGLRLAQVHDLREDSGDVMPRENTLICGFQKEDETSTKWVRSVFIRPHAGISKVNLRIHSFFNNPSDMLSDYSLSSECETALYTWSVTDVTQQIPLAASLPITNTSNSIPLVSENGGPINLDLRPTIPQLFNFDVTEGHVYRLDITHNVDCEYEAEDENGVLVQRKIQRIFPYYRIDSNNAHIVYQIEQDNIDGNMVPSFINITTHNRGNDGSRIFVVPAEGVNSIDIKERSVGNSTVITVRNAKNFPEMLAQTPIYGDKKFGFSINRHENYPLRVSGVRNKRLLITTGGNNSQIRFIRSERPNEWGIKRFFATKDEYWFDPMYTKSP